MSKKRKAEDNEERAVLHRSGRTNVAHSANKSTGVSEQPNTANAAAKDEINKTPGAANASQQEANEASK
jgi:hypothetical protein